MQMNNIHENFYKVIETQNEHQSKISSNWEKSLCVDKHYSNESIQHFSFFANSSAQAEAQYNSVGSSPFLLDDSVDESSTFSKSAIAEAYRPMDIILRKHINPTRVTQRTSSVPIQFSQSSGAMDSSKCTESVKPDFMDRSRFLLSRFEDEKQRNWCFTRNPDTLFNSPALIRKATTSSKQEKINLVAPLSNFHTDILSSCMDIERRLQTRDKESNINFFQEKNTAHLDKGKDPLLIDTGEVTDMNVIRITNAIGQIISEKKALKKAEKRSRILKNDEPRRKDDNRKRIEMGEEADCCISESRKDEEDEQVDANLANMQPKESAPNDSFGRAAEPSSIILSDTSSRSSSSSTLSLDPLLESNFMHWTRAQQKLNELSADFDFELDGEKVSGIMGCEKFRLLKKWRESDEKAKKREANRTGESESGLRKTRNKEIPDEALSGGSKTEMGEEKDSDEHKLIMMRRQKKRIRSQIHEAISFAKIFGIWIEKEWEVDEEERKMWEKAKNEMEEKAKKNDVNTVSGRKKETLEELKRRLAEVEGQGKDDNVELEELKATAARKEQKLKKKIEEQKLSHLERVRRTRMKEKEKERKGKSSEGIEFKEESTGRRNSADKELTNREENSNDFFRYSNSYAPRFINQHQSSDLYIVPNGNMQPSSNSFAHNEDDALPSFEDLIISTQFSNEPFQQKNIFQTQEKQVEPSAHLNDFALQAAASMLQNLQSVPSTQFELQFDDSAAGDTITHTSADNSVASTPKSGSLPIEVSMLLYSRKPFLPSSSRTTTMPLPLEQFVSASHKATQQNMLQLKTIEMPSQSYLKEFDSFHSCESEECMVYTPEHPEWSNKVHYVIESSLSEAQKQVEAMQSRCILDTQILDFLSKIGCPSLSRQTISFRVTKSSNYFPSVFVSSSRFLPLRSFGERDGMIEKFEIPLSVSMKRRFSVVPSIVPLSLDYLYNFHLKAKNFRSEKEQDEEYEPFNSSSFMDSSSVCSEKLPMIHNYVSVASLQRKRSVFLYYRIGYHAWMECQFHLAKPTLKYPWAFDRHNILKGNC
ncbi:uncharacterized protein MONOS_10109 [Monocercomonoides exilis]|uniref:uncharacterized protein n=1 Tax=Monocercomonoides exilis TaxID=2049356 RepID=UPI003559A05E|nr:hypothetical protein MONOS_10109 [Monocercomonoides exilis]|eukprot:MONOS_10109.1-p1 / transcript=MONOS_10109.1 / gene=MONOS_10109 / organism=Monocercomonoides_exilis_PA203 / gene_product=unspecified product / transcript_product=unspecified product / location=Mono_scaffold00445:337-3625(+) / protein_length=1046 / sequence_SO=supercontig / SO=protein_coding / is_pseudo=false